MNDITKLIAVTIAGLIVTTMVVLVVLISVGSSKAHASTQAAFYAVASHAVERGGHGKH